MASEVVRGMGGGGGADLGGILNNYTFAYFFPERAELRTKKRSFV